MDFNWKLTVSVKLSIKCLDKCFDFWYEKKVYSEKSIWLWSINQSQSKTAEDDCVLIGSSSACSWMGGNNGDMTWVDNFRLSTYIFLSHYFVMQGVELLKTEEQRSLADGQIASHEEPSWFILSLVCFWPKFGKKLWGRDRLGTMAIEAALS